MRFTLVRRFNRVPKHPRSAEQPSITERQFVPLQLTPVSTYVKAKYRIKESIEFYSCHKHLLVLIGISVGVSIWAGYNLYRQFLRRPSKEERDSFHARKYIDPFHKPASFYIQQGELIPKYQDPKCENREYR